MRLLVAVGVVVFVAMVAYALSLSFQKPTPVVVVRPSQNQSAGAAPGPVVVGAQPVPVPSCMAPIYIRIHGTQICAERLIQVVVGEAGTLVEFERGTVSGVFSLSAASCALTTTPGGVSIPCRAQILIPPIAR